MKTLLVLLPLLGLSACAATQPTLGEATAYNTQLQAVTPTAEQKADTFIPADSQRQRLARDAYRRGEVKELKDVSTSN